MPLDKEALKAQLVAQYMAHLDALLEQVETESELDLTAIEELALKLRQNVGQDATQVLAQRESEKSAVDVLCPECQEVMRTKGRKGKWVKTRSGTIRVERDYYYCDHCQRGHFPPG
jgi:uncharacterized protein with PIN domain